MSLNDKNNRNVNDGEIINDDKYNVEIANDFTIPTIKSDEVNVDEPITGYTAGLITRDLVSMGEEMLANQDHNKKTKK